MKFDVKGPFVVKRNGNAGLVTAESQKKLKEELDKSCPGLSAAIGCYVFAIKAGKGYTPFYVGQTNQMGLVAESLNSLNREKYNSIVTERRGTPVLFFVPMLTPEGRFRKKPESNSKLASINFLERWLISAALEKNEKLINTKETRMLRNLHVVGILNSKQGSATKESTDLRRALF